MELRIFIYQISESLAGICRDKFCYLRYALQNKDKFPNIVRNGRLESFSGSIFKEFTALFVILEPLHVAQNVILHHSKSETCNPSRGMGGLSLDKVKESLPILVFGFCCPSHRLIFISIEEGERMIKSRQFLSLPLPLSPAEEGTSYHFGEFDIDGTICTSEDCVALVETFLLLFLFDDSIYFEKSLTAVISGLSKFYHTQQKALDVTVDDDNDKISISKPSVYEQLVEMDSADSVIDCIFDHLDGFVCLLHVCINLLRSRLTFVFFRESGLAFFVSEDIRSIFLLAFLLMEREVEHQLVYPFRKEQCKVLVAKDALQLEMRPNTTYQFGLPTRLGCISIICNQPIGLVLDQALLLYALYQTKVHCIEQFVPSPDITIIRKTINMSFSQMNRVVGAVLENWQTFFTTKKGKSISRLSSCKGDKLAVFVFLYSNLAGVYVYVFLHLHNAEFARLYSLSENKLLGSDKIAVPFSFLFEFALLLFLVILKILIFFELLKFKCIFCLR